MTHTLLPVVTNFQTKSWKNTTPHNDSALSMNMPKEKDLNRAQQQELEEINKLTTRAKLNAEVKCQKIPLGKVPWCPSLTKAIHQILY